MSLHTFLADLESTGRVRIVDELTRSNLEVAECDDLLRRRDQSCAVDLAGLTPPLDLEAARWAAMTLYCACQFLVFRHIAAADIESDLTISCPNQPCPSVCWSVDLYLRHVPDVLALARGLAKEDALVVGLERLAAQWPLSSVGARAVGPIEVTPFIEHAGLRTLYIDRIIEHADSARLEDPRVRAALDEAIGMHTRLAGRLVSTLSHAVITNPVEVRHD